MMDGVTSFFEGLVKFPFKIFEWIGAVMAGQPKANVEKTLSDVSAQDAEIIMKMRAAGLHGDLAGLLGHKYPHLWEHPALKALDRELLPTEPPRALPPT